MKLFTPTKLWMFCLFALAFFVSCEPEQDLIEETIVVVHEPKRQTNILSFDKLPLQLMESVDLLERTVRSNNRSTEELLIVDQSQIIEVIDSLSNAKFSIRFRLPDQPVNVLYNLILGTNADGAEINPFVLKYTANNIDEVYSEGYFDVGKMRGTISEYRLDTFLVYVEAITDRSTNVEPDPCAEYSNENNDEDEETTNDDNSNDESTNNGGGGTSGDTNNDVDSNWEDHHSPDPTGGNGEFENTNTDDTTNDCSNIWLWTNGTTGEVTGISWTCTDGSSGYGDLDRSTSDPECPGNGDVGVNINWPYTDCASFEYANRNGIKGAHTTGVNETFVATAVTSPSTSELNIKNIFFPSLFFTMPSHWTNGRAATVTARAVDDSIDETKEWFAENPLATDDELKNAWLGFMRSKLNFEGGNVYITPLFYVRSPAPYSTSWFLSDCG